MLLRNNDYRSTANSAFAPDISEKKNNLDAIIRSKHTKAKIMYNIVKDRSKEYFPKFTSIYNEKCAYCGLPIGIFPITLFEVDHFTCEDSFPKNTEGRSLAGKIENLVLTCYHCNRGKSNFRIENKYKYILNPDNASIANVFVRDKDYSIKIHKDYTLDPVVNNFYTKLLLNHEFRRLDYLLMNISDMIDNKQNTELADILAQKFHELLKKRNKIIPDMKNRKIK